MAYAMLSSYGKVNRAISAAAAVLRGYNSVYPLLDVERQHLVLLMASRLACSVTLGAFSYQNNPGNKYLLMHAEPAWKALEMIWGFEEYQRERMARAIRRVFDQACLYDDSGELSCYDLAVPDPVVADLLESVRVHLTDGANWTEMANRSSATSNMLKSKAKLDEPPRKKAKMNEDGTVSIAFISETPRKLQAAREILFASDESMGFDLFYEKVDLPDISGDPNTIAIQKCTAAANAVGGPVIVEEFSVSFGALNGLPGPYIHLFLDKCGPDGLNKMLEAFDEKSAYAESIVAFSSGPGQDPALFVGKTNGKIVAPRSSVSIVDANSSFDAIFEPDESGGKTYAEMDEDEKTSISHRHRSFQQLRSFLNASYGKSA